MPGSLAYGVPDAAPGTIVAQSLAGRVVFPAREGRSWCFGRGGPDVHVCVGQDDLRVSREHGTVTYRQGVWWVENVGTLPLRLPGSRMLLAGEEPVPLSTGYTPLFVHGSPRREHLLELFVVNVEGRLPVPRHADATQPPRIWRLTEDERLVLTVLGQRYLRHEAFPQPLTWQQTAVVLDELRPDDGWNAKKVEHLVVKIRQRLSRGGVPGLTMEEIGTPVGNALNDNLLRELVTSTSLVPADLATIDCLLD
jgi:hypothetical protein